MSQEAFPLADVDVVVRGDISPEIVDYTRDKVVRTTRFADRPVLMARVVLTVDPDPAHDRPAQAEATIDVSGVPVRAKVAATTPTEAADFLQDRLRRRLDQLSKRRSDRHRWVTEVLAAAQVGNQRPRYAERPPEEREVVRRKTFAVAPLTPDEAAYEMDLLEHDFYLFVDANTGQDAVIHRRPDGAFGLAEAGHALVPPPEPSRMVLEPAPPRLSEADAISRLDAAGEPFVFHVDPQGGRGRVLYRRFDGNYGVIVIAEG